MKEIFYAIADFFDIIFYYVELTGNTLNYFYIAIIFVFLVLWTVKMIKHRKDNEEHAPL